MIPSDFDYSGLVRPIREDIIHIDIPIPHVLRNVNLYLFLGREPALIDAGPFHPFLAEVVEGALRYAGSSRLSYLYLTHSHIDHFGSADRIRRSTGAVVAAHRYEAPRIERVRSRLRREYRCYADLSAALGFPKEVSDSVFSIAHRWIELSEPCPLGLKLEGGERVPAGDRLLEVVHTPGHTAGHLCFYEPEEGILFSGDHLMRSITPNPELYCPPRQGRLTGLPQFISSLERLKDMRVETAYPGHGRPISNVRRRIDFNILHHRKRLEKTEEAVMEGWRTVWEVALRLFPQVRDKPPDVDHFLALKEALGHLLILEEGGRVRRREEDGVWRFEPATARPN
ncbi:MBL fold metallo-hydrolase [Candidatus Solincola tengchongensis]|uniref:MBL fold metallo-hydrolase n=1 Tax=Candidatus Solincola tengchongensis TaxID=2900693 RepID=UPI002580F5A8|nr:MBL fold metallo-hydrolase [Candidatus Solincola tengchongensis]